MHLLITEIEENVMRPNIKKLTPKYIALKSLFHVCVHFFGARDIVTFMSS